MENAISDNNKFLLHLYKRQQRKQQTHSVIAYRKKTLLETTLLQKCQNEKEIIEESTKSNNELFLFLKIRLIIMFPPPRQNSYNIITIFSVKLSGSLCEDNPHRFIHGLH